MPEHDESSANAPSKKDHQARYEREINTGDLLPRLIGEDSCPENHALSIYLNHSPDPVILFDERSEVIAKNQRAYELWGGMDNFIPAQLINKVAHVEARGSALHEKKKNRLVAINTCAGRRYFLPTIFRLFDRETLNSEVTYKRVVACILKDETIWERSERIRKNLLSSISHELNTPLTSARLALYLLAEQQIGALNDNQLEMVERAKQDLDREIITIRNVIDMIRLEDIEPEDRESEELNLHELVEEVIGQFETQIESMQLPIRRNYSRASPRVFLSKETAEMVVYQLFASLFKYTGEGASLEIATKINDGHCSLQLITHGAPLEDFLPDDLFTIPMESDRTRKLPCADLGLRVAHEMIVPYGGFISCKRLPKSGKVLFQFPRT
jgi:signal transduction histidine kinase